MRARCAPSWSYNLGLKSTPLSLVAYLVGFGVLPAIATLARADPAWPSWWAVTVGALLGAAAHFANAAPDLEDDAKPVKRRKAKTSLIGPDGDVDELQY